MVKPLEHFAKKWAPVFRAKNAKSKELERVRESRCTQLALEFDEPLIFLGGSKIHWKHLRTLDPHPIIAVDGGANALLKHGLNPNYICGDFDSITPKNMKRLREQGVEIIPLPDQNATDFEKALAHFQAPVIYAYGMLDGRMDHALHALALLSQNPQIRLYLIGATDTAFIFPSGGEMSLPPGCRISFWSANEAKITRSHGLEWPLDGLKINAQNMSISNAMNQNTLCIEYTGAPLITLIPTDFFKT